MPGRLGEQGAKELEGIGGPVVECASCAQFNAFRLRNLGWEGLIRRSDPPSDVLGGVAIQVDWRETMFAMGGLHLALRE